jgi:hypothetical protein
VAVPMATCMVTTGGWHGVVRGLGVKKGACLEREGSVGRRPRCCQGRTSCSTCEREGCMSPVCFQREEGTMERLGARARERVHA